MSELLVSSSYVGHCWVAMLNNIYTQALFDFVEKLVLWIVFTLFCYSLGEDV